MALLAEALVHPTQAERAHALLAGSQRIAPQIAVAHISLWDVASLPDEPPRRIRHQHVSFHQHDPDQLERFFSDAHGMHAVDLARQLIDTIRADGSGATVYRPADFELPAPWRQTDLFRYVFQPAGLADELAMFWLKPDHQLVHGGICPGEGQADLTDVQAGALAALLRCLGPLAECTLRPAAQDTAALGLSPRQAQVLQLALGGDSEAQIARCMHRSPHTIHSHMRAIYRHFNVTSRAELLAHFLDRTGRNNA